jgi:HPt (histidine-containing phosphotransfer) domain-containing protein
VLISIKPEIAAAFLTDAGKAISILEEIFKNGSDIFDIKLYITTIHGMKSALANVGETELAGLAVELEKAGEKQDKAKILSETPKFITSLKMAIEKLTPEDDPIINSISDDDMGFLREKLTEIKTACESYNKRAAKIALSEIKKRAWTSQVKEALAIIDKHLLHSEFEKIVNVAENLMEVN